ncbi:uncharacterized protein LOC129914932 [Episyrphus balteatus]|uniref:uncharacterized protein LOC129914932 n=1 Tax=Episyrphus balteatus TaxID=286459 RepID=UPI0024860A52|nr:uncharacterized protein LOC129914932 [Episyrphus balteatus]
MKVFFVSLFVATLALASFANVIPSNEENLLDESFVSLAKANVTSVQNATTLDLGEAMTELLISVKNAIPCGNASLGIPPMSPYRIPSLNVNFTGEHLSLKGTIDNLVISGMDDFLIIQLATNKTNNRTEVDILYKGIHILGKFNLHVEANLSGFKYVQPLKGFINFQILNMRDALGFTMGQNEAGGIHISNMEYSSQVGDIQVNSLNTEWSVAVNNFANQYIRDASLLFLQTNREFIGKMYSEYVTMMLNNSLKNVPYSSLVPSIASATQLFKSMRC